MQLRLWLLTIVTVMVISALLAGVPFAKPPVRGGPKADADFDDATPEPPLPPGIKERVFIHLPRTYKPGHLGTCTVTTDSTVDDYGLTGWRMPDSGITWKLNPSTVPSSLATAGKTAPENALNAISAAFAYG